MKPLWHSLMPAAHSFWHPSSCAIYTKQLHHILSLSHAVWLESYILPQNAPSKRNAKHNTSTVCFVVPVRMDCSHRGHHAMLRMQQNPTRQRLPQILQLHSNPSMRQSNVTLWKILGKDGHWQDAHVIFPWGFAFYRMHRPIHWLFSTKIIILIKTWLGRNVGDISSWTMLLTHLKKSVIERNRDSREEWFKCYWTSITLHTRWPYSNEFSIPKYHSFTSCTNGCQKTNSLKWKTCDKISITQC